jgi:solute carrier family 24 (sodium/potassium/calcium exchanger), member 6
MLSSVPTRRHQRPRYSAARTFFTTLALGCMLGAYVVLNEKYNPNPAGHELRARDLDGLDNSSDVSRSPPFHRSRAKYRQCHLVHHAKDQCAYVRKHCPDEQAGIFAYLELYYCDLSNAQPLAGIILTIWLCLLFSTIGIAASDFFCINLSTIANMLHMSQNMAGVTFLAFGNGSPDVFSTFAAMNTNSGSLAVGELIGAAGFITAVVAGSMAIVRPFKVPKLSFTRDVIFFLIAAAFSMTFLYDGKLHVWECLTMVGLYIFYVITVLVWAWWMERRKRKRRAEAAARAHFAAPGHEEAEVFEQYRDDEDEDGQQDGPGSMGARSPSGSLDAVSALERGGSYSRELSQERRLEDDEEEADRERFLGEINSNMRLSRPRMRSRANTQSVIRPSLVGALEFRAVMASLQKSRNLQPVPLGVQRYSDDDGNMSTVSDPTSRPARSESHSQPSMGHLLVPNDGPSSRMRAVSVNDADSSRAWERRTRTPRLQPVRVPSADLLGPVDEHDPEGGLQLTGKTRKISSPPSSAHSRQSSRSNASLSPRGGQSPDHLGPPDPNGPMRGPSGILDRQRPRLTIPGTYPSVGSPTAPFPAYTDAFTASPMPHSRPPSIHLPPPSRSPSDYQDHDTYFGDGIEDERPLSWWPYDHLPAPGLILSTLFPTLVNWKAKTAWEKLLGIVACPSVFLLTLTLPVVDTQADDEDEEPEDPHVPDLTISPPKPSDQGLNGEANYSDEPRPGASSSQPLISVSDEAGDSGDPNYASALSHGVEHGTVVAVPAREDATQRRQSSATSHPAPSRRSTPPQQESPRPWNRWLLLVQLFTAPLFMATIYWANTQERSHTVLLRGILISLLVSLVLLIPILLFSTPARAPTWRPFLCFAGFLVSIAWISTIANEVVGVLKTLGVVVDISDAILGLTIFAVGNSLGDLVADITVARLGFPVMALSACFGGPLLNILLGIGVSGCWITLRGAKAAAAAGVHLDHVPSYHVDVGRSLIISGITLLVTLAGLLVAVPLRGWRMDRWIGWGLVALWAASTIANVVLEAVARSSGSGSTG